MKYIVDAWLRKILKDANSIHKRTSGQLQKPTSLHSHFK